MGKARNRISIAVVAMLLGVLVVAQIRSVGANTGLANQTAQDLTLLVANLNTQNEELRGEVATLERQLASLTESRARGESAAGQIRADLDRIQAWAGLRDVAGSGISVRVSGSVDGQGVEDFLNELHNAGAEAIAIEGVRIVPGSVVAGPVGGLSVENAILGASFEIRAIGSPEILTGSLTRAGGIIAQLSVSFPDLSISVTPLDAITVPATQRDLTPINGKPSL
ncbi:MAG: DUF881 domain-containing protein [Chloroflexi bacterium]|nr:DUF881 domain-containing protein [Chloroflexota bacterium]